MDSAGGGVTTKTVMIDMQESEVISLYHTTGGGKGKLGSKPNFLKGTGEKNRLIKARKSMKEPAASEINLIDERQLKKLSNQSMQMIDRLAKGQRAELKAVDMKKMTEKNYRRLPEVVKKQQEEERRNDSKKRTERVKTFDMKVRGALLHSQKQQPLSKAADL